MDTHSLPLLRTKLHRPRVPVDFVCRERLHEALDRGSDLPLTLVSAPAGYGKSLLVSHWVESRSERYVWLSLDDSDTEFEVFLAYLVAAIEKVLPDACPRTRGLIRSTTAAPCAIYTKTLINELDALSKPFLLVLDDYHRVGPNMEVHKLLRQLLENPPSQMRLLLLTRRDPPLQLPRLRSLGQLTEIRLADLRFSKQETRAMLHAAMQLDASDEAIANLQKEMEGWAAGLRLVSLALRHSEHPDSALCQLRGGVQSAREYLVQEVLDREPPPIRSGLLAASILERFCPSLVDALCPRGPTSDDDFIDGASFVHELQESNLFTISLDGCGKWFRYHHLFRELLRAELTRREDPSTINALHIQASEWFESNDLVDEAIQHALAAGAVNQAAEIIERQRRSELDRGGWWNVERWLSLLPHEVLEQRPGLLLARIQMLHFHHQHDAVAQIVEQLTSIVDEATLDPLFLGELRMFQGSTAFWSGHLEEARALLGQAEDLFKPPFEATAGLTQIYSALTEQMLGHVEPCLHKLGRPIQNATQYSPKYQGNLACARGLVQTLSGNLHQAVDEGKRLLRITRGKDMHYLESWGNYLAGSNLLRLGEANAAVKHFQDLVEQRHYMYARAAIDSLAGLVLACQSVGDHRAIDATIESMLEFAGENADPAVESVSASARARLALAQGDVEAARRWAHGYSARTDAELLFVWLENPAVTQARVWIATGSKQVVRKAFDQLSQLAKTTSAVHNGCQLVEIQVLQSVALDKLGRSDEALKILEEVVEVVCQSGYTRPFVEAESVMAEPLRRQNIKCFSPWLSQILTDMDPASPVSIPEAAQPLLEALTVREEEVLDLLAQRLRDKEIAGRLFISLETVKSHLKHLYQKLHVGNRREAVAVGRQRGLIKGR